MDELMELVSKQGELIHALTDTLTCLAKRVDILDEMINIEHRLGEARGDRIDNHSDAIREIFKVLKG